MKKHAVLVLIVFSLLLSGCFAKKKRSYSSKESTKHIKDQKLKEVSAAQAVYYFNSPQEYIDTFAPIAIEEMELYGIPASITLAQGILESAAGQSNLVKKSNNHFGIKCHTSWQGASTSHDDDEKGECFRKYLHPRESYRDHSLFLVNGRRYSFLFDFSMTDYKAWAKGLKKAGYATDPKYPDKLIKKIEDYRLDQYDNPKLAKKLARKQSKEKEEIKDFSAANGQIYRVQKGDTLYSISKKYGLSVALLKRLNGLVNNDISIGDQLKISSK